MTRSALAFVLASPSSKLELSPEHIDADRARIAARFWAGKYVGSNAKAACVERIATVWRDQKRVAEVLASLRPEELAVLGVVKRFGGAISGTVLQRELLARGVLRPEDPNEPVRFRRNQVSEDPVLALCERFVLVKDPGYFNYASYGPLRDYPGVSLPSQLATLIEPAVSLKWKASAPAEGAPESATMRATAQMLVDLEQTARALEGQGSWKVNQGGGLPAAARNRLAKLCPAIAGDPFEPPDRVAFDYSLLCALGAVQSAGDEAWVERERTDHLFHRPPEVQASEWIRAWLTLRLWQDGIGAVPERDSEANPTRIHPDRLRVGRGLLAWALTRVAHSGSGDWLDLETFILDLYAAAGDRGLSFYWHGFAWQPRFASAAGKEEFKAGPERMRAFWMDREGVWTANALLSTFVHLGLVERGRSGGTRSTRWCFRLTEVGQAVFGAPEVQFKRAAGSEKCLTIQPNHEVLLYLDGADGEVVTTLGRMASRESAAGLVQTFKLTRESVYGALEGGMTPAAIESFLSTRSRSGLPENVSQSLAEWSRKRDALVVRSEVAVEYLRDGRAHRGQALGPCLFLASPRVASKEAKDLGVATESKVPSREWKVDEHGVVSSRTPMSLVGKARLQRFARLSDGSWRITAESVRAARQLGIPADQILDWLAAHVSHEVPPILATAIRKWAGGSGKVFLGGVVLLQVNDPKDFDALRQSERFRPFLKGTLAPGCFVVTGEGRKEATKLLRELGFSLDAESKLASPEETLGVDDDTDQTIQLPRMTAIGRLPGRR